QHGIKSPKGAQQRRSTNTPRGKRPTLKRTENPTHGKKTYVLTAAEDKSLGFGTKANLYFSAFSPVSTDSPTRPARSAFLALLPLWSPASFPIVNLSQ